MPFSVAGSGSENPHADDATEQFTCGHFKKANEWLEEQYGADGVINWNLVPEPPAASTVGLPVATGKDGEASSAAAGQLLEEDLKALNDAFDDDSDVDGSLC
jgi:hypothetical protein